jgi:septal ring factor EnvC (AmiA/AmiB activator)
MMRFRFPRFLFLCLAGCILTAGLSPAPSPASNLEKGLSETRKKIQAEKKALQDLDLKGKNLLESLEALDKEIGVAEQRSRVSETRMAGLEKEKKKLRNELKALEGRIERQKNEQDYRLVAYYRLGKTGMLPVLFSEASPPEKFRNLDSLKRLLVADWQRLKAFHDLQQERQGVEVALEERLRAEAALLETIRERKKALKASKQRKNALLFSIDQDQNLHGRLLEELRQAEEELLERIQRPPPAPVIVEKGPLRPQKGRLAWPVKGKVHQKFGINRDVRSKGIDIKAKPGTPVRAIWGGSVAFADWFRGYGKLLIIHHGEKDYTVVAHLNELTKTKGERVEAGEVLGHAGATGSVDGCLVHFEVWHAGKPEDPLKWLQKGGGQD